MSDIDKTNPPRMTPENLQDFLLPPSSTPQPNTPEPHKDLAPLRDALTVSLMPDDNGETMLRRQMRALEALFDTTLAAYAGSADIPLGCTQQTRLALALRLQSQCLNTARTLSTINYMGALKKNLTSPPACGHDDLTSPPACGHDTLKEHPLPLHNDEQKELGENVS